MEENTTIENRFMYHAPKPGQPEIYQAIRNKAKELAYLIDEHCHEKRERDLAMENLEMSLMWANASIARGY